MAYRVSVLYALPMSPIYAVSDFAEIGIQNAAVQTIQGTLASVTAATSSAAATITPPGGEGASTRAVGQQMANVEQFAAMFTMGLEKLQERIVATDMFQSVASGTEAANAAGFAMS